MTKTNRLTNENSLLVGIGASAGGLEALKGFFKNLPENTGAIFVIVMHRGAEHISLLQEILSRYTNMEVLEAADGMKIQPGHIYLSPAKNKLGIMNNSLHFFNTTNTLLPIDYFFNSLADNYHGQKVGIILSGTGADGTLGLQAIKDAGGMIIVQDPSSAEFSGMPYSAITTGMVNYIMPPEQMPQQLIKYIKTSKLEEPKILYTSNPELVEDIHKIFSLIKQRIGADFSFYKINTMSRRIERRMNVYQIKDPKEYVQYLKNNLHEIDMLFKELLIGVTSFFRDKEAFDSLINKVLPNLLKDKPDGYVFRVWVPACSTGEEAYSIAIILSEYINSCDKKITVQIFATDIDVKAIEIARKGLYSLDIENDVRVDYLSKYFIKNNEFYKINKNIREMLVFATQNVFQDPPFTKIDLISCRNLLIYLDGKLQKQIIPLFCYALKAGGILFLGSSESIGSFHNLFESVDTKWKLFLKKELSTLNNRTLLGFPIMAKKNDMEGVDLSNNMDKVVGNDIANLVTNILLQKHVPPSVIVNSKGQVFYIHGKTGIWLEPVPGGGQSNQNILDMAHDSLSHELSMLIHKASKTNDDVISKGVKFKKNGEYSFVDITAKKITSPESLEGLILITFNQINKEPISLKEKKAKTTIGEDKKRNLAYELELLKKDLSNSIEELEVSNEELQSANEELQSSNEELETSKEEMQSLNEELQTVNAELEEKVNELAHANDDMKNLLNNTGIATVFLDNNFNIRRFTVQAQKIIHLIDRDVGRPLSDIVSDLNYDNLVYDAKTVLKTLVLKEVEVTSKSGEWYFVRILPYRTTNNVIDGLVITFVDISKLKNIEKRLEKSEENLLSFTQKNTKVSDIMID